MNKLIAPRPAGAGRLADPYTYASAGNGTAPHFAAEPFTLNAGVVMLGVPCKGSAPAINDTIGGQAQFMFPSLFKVLADKDIIKRLENHGADVQTSTPAQLGRLVKDERAPFDVMSGHARNTLCLMSQCCLAT